MALSRAAPRQPYTDADKVRGSAPSRRHATNAPRRRHLGRPWMIEPIRLAGDESRLQNIRDETLAGSGDDQFLVRGKPLDPHLSRCPPCHRDRPRPNRHETMLIDQGCDARSASCPPQCKRPDEGRLSPPAPKAVSSISETLFRLSRHSNHSFGLRFSRQPAALYRIDERLTSLAEMLPQNAQGFLAVALAASGQ